MRRVALVSVVVCACGAIAVDPSSELTPGPAVSADSGAGQAPAPVRPEPRSDCRPAPDAIASDVPVSIPPGVTADFAVQGTRPVIAVTPNGDAVVGWGSGGHVRIRLYRDSQWLDVETITAPDSESRRSQTPKVAMRPDGTVVAAYYESASDAHNVVCTRERSSDGTWSIVSTLARTGIGWWQEPSPPEFKLAADGAGNITALVDTEPLNGGLLAFRAPAGGRFGEPSPLTADSLDEFLLAVNASGEALALWAGRGPESVKAAAFSPDAGWGPTEPLGLGGAIRLGVSPERDGSTSVLAIEYLMDGGALVQTAMRARDGGWTAFTELTGFPASYARIASDDLGRTMVAGSSWSPGCIYNSGVMRRDASGKWGTSESIPGAPPGRTVIGEIALSHSGHGVVAWEEGKPSSGAWCVSDGAYLSWLSPEGAWSPPMLLDSGGSQATLALTPSGRALVAWSHGDRVLVRWIDPP